MAQVNVGQRRGCSRHRSSGCRVRWQLIGARRRSTSSRLHTSQRLGCSRHRSSGCRVRRQLIGARRRSTSSRLRTAYGHIGVVFDGIGWIVLMG